MVKVLGDPAPLPEDSFGKKYEDIIPEDATVEEYDSDRFSLVTGRVKGLDEQWLQGVTVSAFGHIEYGTATTDIEGFFSLPVESDGRMTFVFQKDGMIETRRSVDVPWNGYAVTETVVMVAEDTKSTKVVFDGDPTTTITHQSTVVADEFGSRSCTMVFSGDNKAYLTDEDGNDIGELPAVTVRATEFTTLDSMPAVLPPNSAYTYCAELAADGVQRIRFEKPVAVWVDNFLGFPVGTVVPSGYYDRDKGIWISADSGAVVKLLDTDGDGKADAFDSDGDESADGNAAGLDDPVQYAPGKIFWRVEVSHFTPWDLNWGIWPPSDAGGPNPYGEPGGDEQRGGGGVGGGGIGGGPCGNPPSDRRHFNSYIQQRSRVFHEDIPVPGTDITLHYASNRASGYKAVITVPASGEELPGSLKRIDVIARVAGREFREEFPPLPNQKAEFIWDGRDFLGRTVAGSVSMSFTLATER